MNMRRLATLFSTQTTSLSAHTGLFRRISRVGKPTESIIPVLDQWVNEGRYVCKKQLETYIKKMRYYKRFSHALQISMWMTDKRFFTISRGDAAIRLDLISKVHGLEQAEKYFDDMSEELKGLEVYTALLNCYAKEKSVDKAEAIMQKIEDLGFITPCLPYNNLLNLYYKTGNFEKIDSLMHEMEGKVGWDSFTYSIRLSAYAAASDIEGIEKTLEKMESSSIDVRSPASYSIAANAFTKAGLSDKALAILRKAEKLVLGMKSRKEEYEYLLTLYGTAGMKGEMLRIWELFKKNKNISNSGYSSIITSLLKLDDIENAEKMYKEWESMSSEFFDVRIPNFLIGAYSRKGLMEKAEAMKERIVLKGKTPNAATWFYLSTGYLQNNEAGKAVEAIKEAIMVCKPGRKIEKAVLVACLQYLEEKGDFDETVGFINLLKDKDIITEGVHEKMMYHLKEKTGSLVLELKGDGSSAQISEAMFEGMDAEQEEASSEQRTEHLLNRA